MASTLVSPPHDKVLPPVQMPNVFVVPPEEDQSPTWCYFDAKGAALLSKSLDSPTLDNALDDLQAKSQALYNSAGPFGSHNATIMSDSAAPDSPEDMMDQDYPPEAMEGVQEAAHPPLHRCVANAGNTSVGNDSDIVEVFKVRRHRKSQEVNPAGAAPQLKRTKSFKLKAAKMLRTITLKNKASARNKHNVAEVPPLPPMPEVPPAPKVEAGATLRGKIPTLGHRKSAILSQLFHPSATVRSTSNPVGVPRKAPDFAGRDSVSSPTSSSFSIHAHTRPTSPILDAINPPLPIPAAEAEYGIRAASPSPSMRTFSAKPRLSIMGFQRFFSFTPEHEQGPEPEPEPLSPTEPHPLTMSLDSSGPSTVSSAGPETPTDERTPLPPLPYQLQLDLENVAKPFDILSAVTIPPFDFLSTSTPRHSFLPPAESGDISFEMRLDSLHFEALSFDVDRF